MITDHREIPKGKLVLSVSGGDREYQFELPLPMNEAKWTHLKGWIDFIKNEFQASSHEGLDKSHPPLYGKCTTE